MPRARVWRSLTDTAEFGSWFGAKLEGEFAIAKRVRGKITSPGFDRIPAGRRAEAFRMNTEGWAAQLENIQRHVAG